MELAIEAIKDSLGWGFPPRFEGFAESDDILFAEIDAAIAADRNRQNCASSGQVQPTVAQSS